MIFSGVESAMALSLLFGFIVVQRLYKVSVRAVMVRSNQSAVVLQCHLVWKTPESNGRLRTTQHLEWEKKVPPLRSARSAIYHDSTSAGRQHSVPGRRAALHTYPSLGKAWMRGVACTAAEATTEAGRRDKVSAPVRSSEAPSTPKLS